MMGNSLLDVLVFGRIAGKNAAAFASEHGAVDLAQGFPEDEGPEFIRRHAAAALIEGRNQYVSSWGLATLREAIAERVRMNHGVAALLSTPPARSSLPAERRRPSALPF